jgi:hypothetical protein
LLNVIGFAGFQQQRNSAYLIINFFHKYENHLCRNSGICCNGIGCVDTKPGHDIVMVLTQPDRPAGRGMQMTASAVKLLAQQRQLPILQPPSLKSGGIPLQLQSLNADVMVVAAYGLILPQAVLAIPPIGLPEYPCFLIAALARRCADSTRYLSGRS